MDPWNDKDLRPAYMKNFMKGPYPTMLVYFVVIMSVIFSIYARINSAAPTLLQMEGKGSVRSLPAPTAPMR